MIGPSGPEMYVAIYTALAAAVLAALWLPARRAAKVDPAVTLRGGVSLVRRGLLSRKAGQLS